MYKDLAFGMVFDYIAVFERVLIKFVGIILKSGAKHKSSLLLAAAFGAVFWAGLGLFAAPVYAQSDDRLIEGAKLCTRHLQRYEREYGIPAHLLSAIASTESGRYHSGLKIKLPWPWTINAEGKGYFFDTKEQAIAAAQKLRARGVQSMDVGCMQVNLYHHANAFSSLNQAFEPENNIAYAASFLRNLYQEGGNWKKAAGDYHSKTPALGSEYVGLVYNSWRGIVDKLRNARLSVPSSSVNGLQEMQQASVVKPTNNQVVDKPLSPPAPKRVLMANNKGNNAGSTLPQMKTISARADVKSKKQNGMVIVRPEIKVVDSGAARVGQSEQNRPPEPMVIADASPFAAGEVSKSMGSKSASDQQSVPQQAKVIHLDHQVLDVTPMSAANAKIVPKSGPNFIFND